MDILKYIRSEDLYEVDRLLSTGADPNAEVDTNGSTLLHAACKRGTRAGRELVKLLLDHGADPNVSDHDGSTALHQATHMWNIEAVRLLLDHGANVRAQDKDGNTPFQIAARDGADNIRRLLSGETIPAVRHEVTMQALVRVSILEKRLPRFPIFINGNNLGDLLRGAANHPEDFLRLAGSRYILIQTSSRLSPSYRDDLRRRHVHAFEYVSENTYICSNRATLDSPSRFGRDEFEFVAPYIPALKLPERIESLAGSVEIDVVFHRDIDVPRDPRLQNLMAEAAGIEAKDIQMYDGRARFIVDGAAKIHRIALYEQVRHIEEVLPAILANATNPH
ncbi:ankyrin repeat-containing domain protein [Nemania sp. FL0916]|nr:ankyrin repeat-containing domain protein [Nemania sp. FL0916]